MGFIVILIMTTLAIAGSAAFFSIYGLAQIFTGSFWPVVIMASSLEAGKLVAASYLYRFWDRTSFVMKTYLVSAVLVLMVITSAGIFGFLSSAYQQDIIGIKTNRQQIELMTSEIAQLEQLKVERADRKKQIDADIAALPNNFVTGRQRLMESYGPELEQLKKDVQEYTDKILANTAKIAELKGINLEQEAHVGPIIFIAQVFDKDVDDTTKWLIFIIIFAFDPLAVMLTVGANKALLDYQSEKKQDDAVVLPPVDGLGNLDEGEPEPSITDIEQLLQENNNISPEQLQEFIDQLKALEENKDPAKDQMFAELARRQAITKQLRGVKTEES